ncbi:MAG TPA: CDP-glycerol glycerophosphotransferase family protein [Amnibacterium sp.]|nr:CDP-glycerol glycerophosphotransferase family protein [Amnibacterium sp.]
MSVVGDRDDASTAEAAADRSFAAPGSHPERSRRPALRDDDGRDGPELDEVRSAPAGVVRDGPSGSGRRRMVRPADLVRSGLVHQGAGLLAVAGFLVALTLGLPVVAVVTGVVAVAVPLALSAAFRVTTGVTGAPGTAVLPRILLALVVVLERSGSGTAAALSATIATAALVEPILANVRAATPPLAANLPGLSLRPAPVSPRWMVLANATVAVLVVVAVSCGAPSGVLLGVAAAALAITAVVTGDAVLRLLRRRRAVTALPRLLDAYAPVFALHWDAKAGTEFQVTMWLPYLTRIGAPFVVIVRNPDSFDGIARLTDVPVILRQEHGDLDAVVVPSMRAVFYVNNAARNTHFVRFTGLTHIQLNHGESDKASSYSPVFRLYDHDFVAGQAAIDRFAANGVAMPRDLFRIVGRPQVEAILVGRSTSDVPTALYAPTWGGSYADSDYCSLPIGHLIVQELLRRGLRVVFRPHPYTRRYPVHAQEADRIAATLAAHARATGTPHVFGADAMDRSLVDCFNAADLLVSDVSSVVADFLYSEKPFAVVAMHGTVAEFARAFPIAKAAYVIDGAGHDIDRVVDSMTEGDPLAAARRTAKAYFLGDLPAEGYADVFVTAAREAIGIG